MRVARMHKKMIADAAVFESEDVHCRIWHIVPLDDRHGSYALYCNGEWQCVCGDKLYLIGIAQWESALCKCGE